MENPNFENRFKEPWLSESRLRSKQKERNRKILSTAISILLVGIGAFIGNLIVSSQPEAVLPQAPSINVSSECGVEPTIGLPVQEGLVYKQERSKDKLTVSAEPVSREYELVKNSQNKWEITMGSVPCPTPLPSKAPEAPSQPVPEDGSSSELGPEEDPVAAQKEAASEFVDGAGEKAENVQEWTEEYGPGIWERTKELGNGAKEAVEDWSRGAGQ